MAFLTPKQLRKYDWRPHLLIQKIEKEEVFETKLGQTKLFPTTTNYKEILLNGSNFDLRNLRFTDEDGNYLPLGYLIKSEEFGGKSFDVVLQKENLALKRLQLQLRTLKETLKEEEIEIKIGYSSYFVSEVENTPGTPKSDIHFKDKTGKECIWVSHKDGYSPKHFQQYSGMSLKFEPRIHLHNESQDFIDHIKSNYSPFPQKTTVCKKINDEELKNVAVYGSKFGSEFSEQNVQVLLQGEVNIISNNNFFNLTANNVHYNGDVLSLGYEPGFIASYRNGRRDVGVDNARLSISPVGGRTVNVNI